MGQDEKYKCQNVVDSFTAFAKNQGTKQQYRESLSIILPTSPIYDYLEGRLYHPSHTYQVIAQLTESEEKERVNKEIGERKTRLGARINQVTLEVKREVMRDSPLEDLYTKIIDWSTDDDVRRKYEEKLLQRCYDMLTVVPTTQKAEVRQKTEKLASDMVIIKHPFKLAWDIAIEWKDYASLQDYDVTILRQYFDFFPNSGLSKVLQGFMTSELSPFPGSFPASIKQSVSTNTTDESEDADTDADDDADTGGVELPMSTEDRLILMTNGMESSTSILSHRLMGEYYAFLDEHAFLIDLMRTGRQLVAAESQKTGVSYSNTDEALTALLATALVYHLSPKNHPEAKTLFDEILQRNPVSTPALVGIGLIYEEEQDYAAAIDFLDRALKRAPGNVRISAEAAWVKALNGDYERSRDELEDCLSKIEGTDLRSRELRAQTQYRIGVCIWNIDTSVSARKDRSGAYSYFLAALKSNMDYAPAYTSLGYFYADYSKDRKRARKCFQKAFELSASEVDAAERLARTFAEQGEWDLVEVVSQRVVDSGKVKPAPGSKKKGISWPYAALGTAELNKQDYAKSIVSFQFALRISPEDYHSWVGLGESYHNSGRYMAATKAFEHAEKFKEEIEKKGVGETWFAEYMLANVRRELGEYDVAIQGYKAVLGSRPNEFGVSIALLQTLVDSASGCIDKGLFGRASQLATEAIPVALGLASIRPDAFNLWKCAADACSVFSIVQSRGSDFPLNEVQRLLEIEAGESSYATLADVDGVEADVIKPKGLLPEDENGAAALTRCLHGSILFHKRAVATSARDIHAQAVAYFNLGWAEQRAHTCMRSGLAQNKKTTKYSKAAILCFKRAIELEAGNSEFWNALGVATSEASPRVAQHAFVRSLFLNERSAQTWTNLGTLYLLQNDLQLANEAFTRAQSTDPDFAHAWVGQGIAALLFGDPKEAKLLFTHAVEISDSGSLITRRQYALSAFDAVLTSSGNLDVMELLQPMFSLRQLMTLSPSEFSYQHLASLFLERIKDVSEAVGLLSKVCSKVEADYEVTESPESLSRFALAKADLARSQLANAEYEAAIDSGETALQLSAEDAGNELSAESRQKCRLSAHLTVGLAQYFGGHADESLEYFQTALTESAGNPDAVCLLAQVLWATTGEDARAHAREQLFDCIENHPGHVQSVLLLGVIAILDKDTESLEAVASELHALRLSDTVSDAERSQVGEILRAAAAFAEENSEASVLKEVQTDVFLLPHQSSGWSRLADITGDTHPADMALKAAVKSALGGGGIDATVLSQAFAGTGKVGDAQRAIMICPWRSDGWDALAGSMVAVRD